MAVAREQAAGYGGHANPRFWTGHLARSCPGAVGALAVPVHCLPVTAISRVSPQPFTRTVSEAGDWEGAGAVRTLLSPVHRATLELCPTRTTSSSPGPLLASSHWGLGPSSAHSIVAWAGPQHLGASPLEGCSTGYNVVLRKGPREGSKL